MIKFYNIQKDALEAVIREHAEDISTNLYDSFRKELFHLLNTEQEGISQSSFMHIATRYGLTIKVWEDYQKQFKIELAKSTTNFLERVKQFEARVSVFKHESKDSQSLGQARNLIQGINI